MFAYVSIIDTDALNGMRGDVMTAATAVLGVVVAVAVVGVVIRVITR